MNVVSEIYKYIKQLAESDTLVNSVRKYDMNNIDIEKVIVPPLVNVRITSGRFTNGSTIVLNIELGCFDIRDNNKEINTDDFWGQDNEVDNLNTCIGILNRMWLKMYRDFDNVGITASENPSLELGYIQNKKMLDGAVLTFEVEVPNTTITLCPE